MMIANMRKIRFPFSDGSTMMREPQTDDVIASDWITGAEVRARTGWNAQQLRRRINAGKFPPKIDVDRWRRCDVEDHLAGKRSEQTATGWTVNEEAIRLALAGLVRRAKISAAPRGRGRYMAHSIPRTGAIAPRRVAPNH